MSSHPYDSHKFSEDISRDMCIPERIGASGGALDSGTKGFAVDPDYPAFSRIVEDMNIPDRILATGEASTVESQSRDPLDPNSQVLPSDVISIDSPPVTITLDQMRYPDIVAEQPGDAQARRRRHRGSSGGGDVAVSGAGGLVSSVTRLQKRLEALEAENEQRRRRELVLYPAIGIYFLFKIVGWLFRPRRI